MAVEENALKPCPFCGGKASVSFYASEDIYTVECCECCAMVGRDVETYSTRGRIFFVSKVEAIEAWNRRNEHDYRVETREA